MKIDYTLKTGVEITELNMVEVYINLYNKERFLTTKIYSFNISPDARSISVSTDGIFQIDLVTKKPYALIIQVPIFMHTKETEDLINVLLNSLKGEIDEDLEIVYEILFDDDCYEKENVPFEEVLPYLKQGYRACRSGWNGKGMFVVMQKAYPDGIPCNKQTAEVWGLNEGDLFKCNPYFQIKNVNGSHSMWVPSVGDLLADDWFVMKK